jgi:hypothetical protein
MGMHLGFLSFLEFSLQPLHFLFLKSFDYGRFCCHIRPPFNDTLSNLTSVKNKFLVSPPQ